jgi:hypothetical protein
MKSPWLVVALLLAGSAGAEQPICKSNPAVIAKCFTVHGRLRAYNGNPTFRIWPIGTKRILGVTGPNPGDTAIMPEGLACGFFCDVVGDFEVCPFSQNRPGVMQRVCIESTKNTVKTKTE